jgi:4-hydroxybenzoate polyprenyltransferase
MLVTLSGVYLLTGLHWMGLLGIAATAALLIYQHSIIRADDLSRLNLAFFTTNAWVSAVLFLTVAADVFWFG